MGLFKSKEEKERFEAENKAYKERKELEEKAKKFVLTISASDYAKSQKRNLSHYSFESIFTDGDDAVMRMVQEGIRIGAEKVVDVRISDEQISVCGSSLRLIGTALIPIKQG